MAATDDRLRLLMKATSDVVYDYNLATSKVEWSENIRFWGYDPADVDPGLDWWISRIHPEDRDSAVSHLDLILRNRIQSFDANYRFRCADGF